MNRNTLFRTYYVAILMVICFTLCYNLSAQISELPESDSTEQQYHFILLTRALDLQLTADSLNRSARIKRAGLKNTFTEDEKNKLITEISLIEKKSTLVQKEADEIFNMLQSAIPAVSYKRKTGDSAAVELKEEINGIKVYQYKTSVLPVKSPVPFPEYDNRAADSIRGNNLSNIDEDEFKEDTIVYSESNPISERIPLPGKLVYYIQLGVFSKKVPDNTFARISPVCFDNIKEKGLYKYYAGLYFSLKSAGEALSELKAAGYPESFIVAFNNGEQISTEKARQIEYSQIKF